MTRPLHLVIAISLIASAVASTAYGHARLKSPQPRDNQDGYKDPPRTPPGTGAPCGISEAASQPHNNLTPGAAITVTWEETVNHPGCFVIDFSPANDANFTVLGVKSHMSPPAPANPTINSPRPWSLGVTLPSAPCSKCTLRVRQLMLSADVTDAQCPPATIPAGSTYYSCANVIMGGSGGASGTGGTTGAGGATGAGGRGGASGRGGTTGTGGRGGTTGAAGRGGTTGAAGDNGQAGTSGQAGDNGQAGTSGQAGDNGTSGQAGVTGTSGQAGVNGTSGQAGVNGTSGQAGVNGTSGQAGSGSGAAGSSPTGQSGTSGGGEEVTGGCAIAGDATATAPWALLFALIVLRRRRQRSRS
jgi:uncharacterized protein (TIGR03382 family)